VANLGLAGFLGAAAATTNGFVASRARLGAAVVANLGLAGFLGAAAATTNGFVASRARLGVVC
jgi:hypothetical protein